MTGPTVLPVVDEGLGNSAYLVDIGDGRALVVDASLDLRAVRAAAAERGLTVAFAADTHLHADFVTGALALAATDGATVLASAAGARRYPHTGLADGDEVDLGGLRLQALSTPGHTGEHLAFTLLDGDEPLGVFTGGSLIVGAAARTDLVAPDRTEELARAQYRSLQRLLTLGDQVAVWPTHGAGSFCSAPPGADRTSTIGREKATNALLDAEDEDAFVASLLGSLGSFPPYFLRLAEVNRRGPDLPSSAGLPSLTVAQVGALRADGADMIDVRPVDQFAAGHVPGALSIPLRPVFATWLGWLASHERALVVVRAADQDPDEIRWQALKVGVSNLAGELAGGMDAWTAGGQPTTVTALTTPEDVRAPDEPPGSASAVIDVRQASEFSSGHVPGAAHVELGELAGRIDEVPDGPVVVMCGHGERAMTAASVLERAGRRGITVMTGGADDWARRHGRTLSGA
ncbi:MAG TPA: rhodanese-like domain-containing protein [Actinomycetales bacterium]|nr:rhodanese-like domain-containing protein [Actinomycetales bacterium]